MPGDCPAVAYPVQPFACGKHSAPSRTPFRGRTKSVRLPTRTVFAFRPECCSESQRNGVRLHTGIAYTFYRIPQQCCKRVGLEHIAPHDLRRTCAKLCHSNGGELEQIQFLLGHASVLTTERYLGCKQNLGHPVNDLFNLSTDAPVDENGAQSDQAQPFLRFEPLKPKMACQREQSGLDENGKQQYAMIALDTGT